MNKSQFSNPWARLLGSLIDGVIISIPLAISYFSESKIISILFVIIALLISVYNQIYLLRKRRASIGMKLLELKMYKIKGEEIDNNRIGYFYIIFRNIISSIIQDITYGVENILIFFTKRRQTLHDLFFRSIFIGKPKPKMYYISILIIIGAIILGFIFSPYAFENREILVYKTNGNINNSDAIEIMKEKLKNYFELNNYSLKQENIIEIILPKNVESNLVKEVLLVKDVFLVKELVGDKWIETSLNGSNIVNAEMHFDQDGKIFTKVLFDEAGKKKFSEITTRNLSKDLKIYLNEEIVFSGKVSEKIENGILLLPHQKIKEAVELGKRINFIAQGNPLILIDDIKDKKMLKNGSFFE